MHARVVPDMLPIGRGLAYLMSEQQTVLRLECPGVEAPASAPASELPIVGPRAAAAASWPLEALKWVFSFPVMLGTLLVGRVFYVNRTFFVDPDVWWHIKVGQDILRTQHWPTTDPYSYTAAGTPWIAYEWLGEVILASVARLGGIVPLFVLLVAATSAVTLALYYYATIRTGNCKAGFIPVAVMGTLTIISFTLRPQMFGYLFLVLLLIVLQWFRKGVTWPLWTLPILFLAWVNTHGSFIVGIGVLVVYLCCGLKSFRLGDIEAVAWTAKQRIQLELALLFSAAVLPITPYGARLAVYPFDMMFNQPLNVANVTEWHPMPLEADFGKLFFFVVVAAIVLQLLFRFPWRLEELLLGMAGTLGAFVHARLLLVFVPFFVPILAVMVARFLPPYRRSKEQFFLNAGIMAATLVAMVHYFPSRGYLQSQLNHDFPVEALAYMDKNAVPLPMYNTYYYGGYLVGTGRKTFIDGRGDLFERAGVMGDVLAASQIKTSPLAILDHYQIASCLLVKDEPLAVALMASQRWTRVYSDGTAAIFVRTELAGKPRGGTP